MVDLVEGSESGELPEENELDRLRAALAADVRLRVLGRIIQEYYQARQFDALNLQDLVNRAIAWKTPTMMIPVEELYNCYARACQSYTGEMPLSAYDLVSAWRAIWQDREDGVDKSRLLAQHAKGCCERCYGRGYEVFIDKNGNRGSRKCDHRPFTEEERAEYFEGVEIVRKMREKMRKTREENARIAELAKSQEKREKPKGIDLICSKCSRLVNTLGGWQIGERCGFPGDGGENNGEMILCEGVMQKAPENAVKADVSENKGCRHVFRRQEQINLDDSVYVFESCRRCGETRDLEPGDFENDSEIEQGSVVFASKAFTKDAEELSGN